MGIAVPDLVMDDTGVTLANAYVSFGAVNTHTLTVTRGSDGNCFALRCAGSVWSSAEARRENKAPLSVTQYFATVDDADPTVSRCMTALYGALKEHYSGCVDVFEDGQPAAP